MVSRLKPSNQKINKPQVIGFDIETYNNNKNFLCASLVSDYNELFFKNKHDLIKELKKEKYGYTYIVATNLSFDFFGVFFDTNELKNFKFIERGSDLLSATTYIENGKFTKHPKYTNRHKLTFIDTFNFAPLSVSKWGEILDKAGINLLKLDKPSFLGKKPKNKTEWEIIKRYNIRDSLISMKAYNFLMNGFIDLGANPKTTIASTSMSLFTNRFLKDEYFRMPLEIIDKLQLAYYGGRTEVFKRGYCKNLKYYDINSLYPSVMRNKFPDPNTWRITYDNDIAPIMNYEGVSKVNITAPYMKYPLLPYRSNKKVIFPVGTFTGSYSNIELRKALKLGYKINKVYYNIYFKSVCEPFKDYVDTLYKLRLKYKKQNSPMELIVKLGLNSLYGKFAQRYKEMSSILIEPTIDELNACVDYEQIKGDIFRVSKTNDPPPFTVPIWALYTTAYGRLKLYDYIVKHDAYYCDTDSIITKDTIPESKVIGKMKLELNIKEAIIVRPKFYGLLSKDDQEITKIKGLNERLPFGDFKKLNKLLTRNITKFMKFKECLRRKDIFVPNQLVKTFKRFSLEDDKRLWKNSFNVKQFEISEPRSVNDVMI